jgi:hypothetical protein
MTTQTAEEIPSELPEVTSPGAGVIRDARQRRRRERAAAFLLLLVAIGAVLFLAHGRGGAPPSLAKSSHPTWLTGARLSDSTHLQLLVTENGGPLSIVDVDDRRVQPVSGLGVPPRHGLWGAFLYPLLKIPGGALAVVTRRNCNNCTATETHYFISPDGAVQRTSTFTLAADQYESTPVLGSRSASWVLTHPRVGACTLKTDPGARPAIQVPCGGLAADTQAGLIISATSRMLLVNPRTGRVRARSPIGGQLDVLGRSMVLTSDAATANLGPQSLALTDLTTGARIRLRWPSALRNGYQVVPDQHTSQVAIDFEDPAYAGTQASDVWLLDTRTGKFTHVPGFPILEHLKFSAIAWAADHSLVVAAQGGGRTAIGIWRPGARELHVGAIPAVSGYSQFVTFSH